LSRKHDKEYKASRPPRWDINWLWYRSYWAYDTHYWKRWELESCRI